MSSIAFLSNARNVQMTGNTINVSQVNQVLESNPDCRLLLESRLNLPDYLPVLSALYRLISQDALHDAAREAAVECMEGTRVSVIRQLDRWLEDDRGTDLLWLKGPAGFGKTAIARTLCKKLLLPKGRLGGDFFFSLLGGRTDPQKLVLTIAYRLATVNDALKSGIEKAMQVYPSVVNSTFETQLQGLIVEPIVLLEESKKPRRPLIIVIDGLDECNGEDTQVKIIRHLYSTIRYNSLPIRLLIVSRPEPWIADAFTYVSSLSTISLEQDTLANQGIRIFYSSEFRRIRNDIRFRHLFVLSQEWPSHHDIDRLVELANGQFIFAATIIRFVSEDGCRPMDHLNEFLAIQSTVTPSSNPYNHLDVFYQLILSKTPYYNLTGEILGAMAAVIELPLSSTRYRVEYLDILEVLLGLHKGDAYTRLYKLHSIAYVPASLASIRSGLDATQYKTLLDEQDSSGSVFRFYHKSFVDFLHNEGRSRGYYVDEAASNRRLALQCIHFTQKSVPESWFELCKTSNI